VAFVAAVFKPPAVVAALPMASAAADAAKGATPAGPLQPIAPRANLYSRKSQNAIE
jgi:hypothetical protein